MNRRKESKWDEFLQGIGGTLRGRKKGQKNYKYVCVRCKKRNALNGVMKGKKKIRLWCIACVDALKLASHEFVRFYAPMCNDCKSKPQLYGELDEHKEFKKKWCMACAIKLHLKVCLSANIKCKMCDSKKIAVTGPVDKNGRIIQKWCFDCEPKVMEVDAKDERKWKVVPGYSRYEASDSGEIRVIKTKKIKEPTLNPRGYLIVSVVRDNTEHGYRHNPGVHRLVCRAWHGPPPNDEMKEVDHISGNTTDNSISNLRWASRKQNMEYHRKSGRAKKSTRSVDILHKETRKQLAMCPSLIDAAKFLIINKMTKATLKPVTSRISEACKTNKLYLGFYWKFCEELKNKYDPCNPANPVGEEWKIIQEFNDYQISNHGRIKNLKTNQLLKTHKGKLGINYAYVQLRKDKKQHSVLVHRLLALAFVEENPNPKEYKTVNHIDGNRHNNDIDNLEWAPLRQVDGGHVGNTASTMGIAIVWKDGFGNILKRYGSITQAAQEEGCSHQSIFRSLQKGGEGWEYDTHQINNALEKSKKRQLERAKSDEPEPKRSKTGS
jgi:hypothetical protein